MSYDALFGWLFSGTVAQLAPKIAAQKLNFMSLLAS